MLRLGRRRRDVCLKTTIWRFIIILIILIHIEIVLGDTHRCVVARDIQALAMHLNCLHGQVPEGLIRALQ